MAISRLQTPSDNFMPLDAKIHIPGHTGLVGGAILRRLQSLGYHNFLLRTRKELDLRNAQAVQELYREEKPRFVFLCAAKVGGIGANSDYPAEFCFDNMTIQTSLIDAAYRHDVDRLLFLGSSCIYPRECPQPMREEHLATGKLEPTNRPYALAKIAGIELCWSYNRQYETRNLAVMPTNLYGPGDNFDLHTSHVLPAMIRKFHEAKQRGEEAVTLWGTGVARREFMYVDDLTDACVFLMNTQENVFNDLLGNEQTAPLLNIGTGQEITITDLALLIQSEIGFSGRIDWDDTKPDGTPRKLLDSSRLLSLGWQPTTSLREGIAIAYRHFIENHTQRF